jgi:hypothetical protein
MTTPNLEGAKCVGMHWLFDSTNQADHNEARKLCNTCPVTTACAQVLADVKTVRQHINHRPQGTWAGQLIGVPPTTIKCGTNKGYYKHRRRAETICDSCREAHRAHEAVKTAERRKKAGEAA